MTRLSTSELRKDIAEALDLVASHGERIVLQRRNRDVAVLISVEDYALFKRLEDHLDLEAIHRSKVEPGESVDWEALKRECDL